MNGLDLFSGIGGISIALEPWVKTVAYCEKDPFARHVLMSRMRSGEIEPAPIWDDITTLKADHLPGLDIIFGGFPCQDISAAGLGAGLAGKRSGLFFEIVRLVEETRPSFVFLENVPAIRTRGLSEVISTFTDLRYDCRWTCLSAASIGAPHLRRRWFLLAYANGKFSGNEWEIKMPGDREMDQCSPKSFDDGQSESLADSTGERFPEAGRIRRDESEEWSASSCEEMADTGSDGRQSRVRAGRHNSKKPKITDSNWWAIEPNVGRVANGVPARVDRLRCLGNAVVPAQARKAFEILSGIKGVA